MTNSPQPITRQPEHSHKSSRENPQYDRSTCYFCHEPDEHILQDHHIVPQRFGGSNFKENLVKLCPNCHDKIERLYDSGFYERLDTEEDEENQIKAIIQFLEDDSSGADISTILEVAESLGFEAAETKDELRFLRKSGEVYEPTADHLRAV